jgi:hemerythrin-like domain-containing protein
MSVLMDILKEHHTEMKKHTKVLQSEDCYLAAKKQAFEDLIPILRSHAEAEEKIVYAFMKADEDLAPLAIEGREEHHLADLLAGKVAKCSDSEKWVAEAKVLADLIEHHVEEEEEEIFPELESMLSHERSARMASEYLHIFEDSLGHQRTDKRNDRNQYASGFFLAILLAIIPGAIHGTIYAQEESMMPAKTVAEIQQLETKKYTPQCVLSDESAECFAKIIKKVE